jgi:oxalate decarboxylase/phosphoglucose isomerase-like protein (cupin superfamily)
MHTVLDAMRVGGLDGAGTRPHRVVLTPGDVLFVPSGWAHAVRNLPGPPTVRQIKYPVPQC